MIVELGDLLEGAVWNALVQEFRVDAEDRISAEDVGVEKCEWSSWLDRVEPYRDFAQFDSHRVDVHSVQTAAGDVTERVSGVGGGRLNSAGADASDPAGDVV